MQIFSEYGNCPTEGCDGKNAPGASSQISARLSHSDAGERVMRRRCVRCGETWDESLAGFAVFDVPPGAR